MTRMPDRSARFNPPGPPIDPPNPEAGCGACRPDNPGRCPQCNGTGEADEGRRIERVLELLRRQLEQGFENAARHIVQCLDQITECYHCNGTGACPECGDFTTTGDGGPPYDAATATGMYDRGDV